MSTLQLKREAPTHLYFSHPVWMGLVFLAMAAGLGYFAFLRFHAGERFLFFLNLSFLSSLIGLGWLFWRFEITLDLGSQSYVSRKGFWPFIREKRGVPGDIESVNLDMIRMPSKGRREGTPFWSVNFSFRGWAHPVSVFHSANELKAYEWWEQYAKKLKVPAVDRSGGKEIIWKWEEFEKPLIQRAESAYCIPPLPVQSRIKFFDRPGQRYIVLPSEGIRLRGLGFILAGLLPIAGSTLLMIFLFGYERSWPEKEMRVFLVTILLTFGSLVMGLGLIAYGIFCFFGKEVVRDKGDSIMFCKVFWNFLLHKRSVYKREVKEIEKKISRSRTPSKGAKPTETYEVRIRTKRKIVRLGRHLLPEELDWLQHALLHISTPPKNF